MIPGSDILRDALSVITPQYVTYYRDAGRTENDVGQDVTTYDDPVTISGSFQPVPRTLYQQLGLDLQKSYYNLFTENDIIDLSRDVSGDQIEFNGNRYQCESATNWFDMDGWKQVLCALILDFDS